MRLHLLKIIFFLRVQLSNTCIILVFNMYVKIFHCKSQTEHNLQPFLKCMLKARSKWNWLKTAPLYFKKPAFVFLINTFYKRFSLQGLKMLLKDFWRDRQISSIARKISHSKCARYEFAIDKDQIWFISFPWQHTKSWLSTIQTNSYHEVCSPRHCQSNLYYLSRVNCLVKMSKNKQTGNS